MAETAFTKEELQKLKKNRLISIIQRNGFDEQIGESLQKKDGTMSKNLKKEMYVQLILEKQHPDSTVDNSHQENELKYDEENESDNNNEYESYDDAMDAMQYVTFEEWMHDHIEDGKRKYGVGMCWEFMENGYCHNTSCSYKHPQSSHNNNHNTNHNNQCNVQIHFGKHRGKFLHEIPRSYVLWMKRENVLEKKSAYFAAEMRRVWSDVFY
eukprot:479941_1